MASSGVLLATAVEDYAEGGWRIAGHSRNTCLNYRMRLREFVRWTVDQGMEGISLQEIGFPLLQKYHTHYLLAARTPKGEEIKKNTLRGHLHSLRWIFGHYYNLEVLDENPMQKRGRDGKYLIGLPSPKDAHREWLSDDELLQVLVSAGRQRSEFKAIRDVAVISVLGYTGVRRTELLDLSHKDIDLEKRELVVRSGKGSVRRTIALCPEVVEALEQWIKLRRHLGIYHPKLFTADRGRPLGECGLVALLQEAAIRAGMPADNNIKPHAFRRGAATRLWRATRDIVLVQNFLGHANVKTTMVYIDVAAGLLKDNVDGLSTGAKSSPVSTLQWRP